VRIPQLGLEDRGLWDDHGRPRLRMYPTPETRRLRLRVWREHDLAPFATLNADPRVMEFLPKPLGRADSDALVSRIRDHFARHGFGLWAVEAPGVANFIGFVGLSVPSFQAHFMPCVEIGWRLAHEYWRHGYATEAARAVLAFGFRELALNEIVSFTVPPNWRSRRVMERLDMKTSACDDFEHPDLPKGHPLRSHALYRLSKREWRPDEERGTAEPHVHTR
jgi:RimJ/RimL family protein N-acetyltransferase